MDGTDMNGQLPEAFVGRMRQQLGDELSAFLHALEEPPVRGIRLNPLKTCEAALKYTDNGRIPWEGNGYYLPAESDAGASILHAAGAFYIQEPGEKVLDLCAAPGGKSTQIGCAMRGEGLLVCNEPVPKRAQILSGNIERMGLPNTVVTSEWPDRLADRWQEGFDAVLVDAPCSGEGMFRRDPETRKEWTAERSEGCAVRQREILAAAVRLVRPGGRLVYSTCTYNPAENEENARWLGSIRAFRIDCREKGSLSRYSDGKGINPQHCPWINPFQSLPCQIFIRLKLPFRVFRRQRIFSGKHLFPLRNCLT